MLDYRWHTFMLLCKNLSYTKTAQELHVSQPTITHQIKYLEERYGVQLFEYRNRKLQLTLLGEQMYQAVLKLHVENQRVLSRLKTTFAAEQILNFCCTGTLGEYIMPGVLQQWLTEWPEVQIRMQIQSTAECLAALEEGECSFALVEGYFNKALYQSRVLKEARMLLVVHPHHPLAQREQVELEDTFAYSLLVHHKESRLRGILPNGLSLRNYSYDNYQRVLQVGNANVMKHLVAAGQGIAFLYEDVVDAAVKQGAMKAIAINGFELKRELSLVYLEHSSAMPLIEKVYQDIMAYLSQSAKEER